MNLLSFLRGVDIGGGMSKLDNEQAQQKQQATKATTDMSRTCLLDNLRRVLILYSVPVYAGVDEQNNGATNAFLFILPYYIYSGTETQIHLPSSLWDGSFGLLLICPHTHAWLALWAKTTTAFPCAYQKGNNGCLPCGIPHKQTASTFFYHHICLPSIHVRLHFGLCVSPGCFLHCTFYRQTLPRLLLL